MRIQRFDIAALLAPLIAASTLFVGCAMTASGTHSSDFSGSHLGATEAAGAISVRASTWQPWEWNGYEKFPSLYCAADGGCAEGCVKLDGSPKSFSEDEFLEFGIAAFLVSMGPGSYFETSDMQTDAEGAAGSM